MEDSPKSSRPSLPARCFSRATRKPVNWRTVFAVAAAMRKLQRTRITGSARLKQGAFVIGPLKIKVPAFKKTKP
jgi:hypothetical protein